MNNLDRTLDRTLAGRAEPTEDTAAFVEIARRLEGAFDIEPPSAAREKALFSAAVAARGRNGFPWARLMAPVVAGAALIAALGLASGSALPGDALYPVRQVLQDVGLNGNFLDEADDRIEEARSLVLEAEETVEADGAEARGLAVAAIQELAPVDELLAEIDASQEDLDDRFDRLESLIARATAVIAQAVEPEEAEDRSGPSDEKSSGSKDDSESNSGPGGRDDDASEDADSDDNGSGEDNSDPSDDADSDSEPSGGDSDSDDRDGNSDSDSDDRDGNSDSDSDDRSDSDADPEPDLDESPSDLSDDSMSDLGDNLGESDSESD